MRLPRVRLRTLMFAVAVAALGLAISFEVSRLRELRRRYQIYARHHALRRASEQQEWTSRLAALRKLKGVRIPHLVETQEEYSRWLDERAGYHEARIRYHERLRLRYERAARYPWLPVPPDPPPM